VCVNVFNETLKKIGLWSQKDPTPDIPMKMVEKVQSVPYLPESMKAMMDATATAYCSAFDAYSSALEADGSAGTFDDP
jgi:hypothetical protein